jgi:hypothetical protein
MTKYLAGVLTVIAAGILMIAYALLKPETGLSAFEMQRALDPYARPVLAGERLMLPEDAYAARYGQQLSYPAAYAPAYAGAVYQPAPQAVRTVETVALPQRVVRRAAAPRRDWKKTALVIGGSTASGAGLGAVFGGKKGALIGAAIGGGASTIYEATKR